MIISAAKTSPVGGHPLWHFEIVAAAAVVTFLAIKVTEWWRRSGHRVPGLSRPESAIAALSLASSGIHAIVCAEHFREWVVYGIFFLVASALQAGWAVLVFLRPNRWLLLVGATGNLGVIGLYFLSRIVGIPFGPEAFQPETFDALSMAATICEAGATALAAYLTLARRYENPLRRQLLST